MRKLLLIDGSSMLVTNYYGNLPKSIMFEKDPEKKKKLYGEILHSSDGSYTNAMYGMLRTILKIIDKQKPSHIAFAFDKTRDTFRRQIYADYKGNRAETPDPLKEQFINMENLLKQIGFKVFYSSTYEADDIIGSLAKHFETEIPVVVMTKDHDYLQLVSENTRAWMVQTKQEACDLLFEKYGSVWGVTKENANLPDKVFEFTQDIVFSEEGVRPDQIIDLKGIVGDSADNIPGVKGVSAAAIPLLNEYGTLEGLYEAIEREGSAIEDFWKDKLGVKKGAYKKLIAEGAKDSAILSKKLATIAVMPNIKYQLDDFQCVVDKKELKAVCEKYDFKSLSPTN